MGRHLQLAFLLCLLLLVTGCRDFWEAMAAWDDDCWDWDDCHSRSYYGDNGEYTTMRMAWRCPDDDATVSGNFATSFDSVVITDESGVSVFDGNVALYAWLVTGPGVDWKTEGVELDVLEYYFLSLSTGGTLVLRLVNGMPEDGGGTTDGTYGLIPAENTVTEGDLQNYLETLHEPHAVRSALDVEEVFGAMEDSGSFSGTIADLGGGSFAYGLPVTVVTGNGPVSYDVAFTVRAQAETADVTFQNAYGRESYTTGGTGSGAASASSYTYAIYVGAEAELTRAGEADLADFDLYCGPGPVLRDPVVFGAN